MIKVLHFVTSLNRGGIENWLMNMLRAIDGNVCRMDFLCKGEDVGEMADEAEEMGANIRHVPMGMNPFGFVSKARTILTTGSYDIVHSHLEAFSALPVLAARGLGIPVISSFHNIEFEPQTELARHPVIKPLRRAFKGASIRYALRSSSAVTGCSRAVLERLNAMKPGLQRKSRVIYYGVEVSPRDKLKNAAARGLMGIATDAPVLMHVGRFVEQKNHEGLLRIFKEVKEFVPEALMVLIGDGPLRPRIEERAKAMGVGESVLFLGTRGDARFLMQGCDVFLFPSLYEGFGLVALEANAAGVPVVGSKVSGIEEAVEDGQTGLLFPPEDVEGMAKACVHLIRDMEARIAYGRRGTERARKLFSVERSASDLLSTYRDVLQGTCCAKVRMP